MNRNDQKENFESLLKSYQAAEKRISGLTKELELKDMQINSQMQMLNRRNIEITNITSKLETLNSQSQSFIYTNKTTQEVDKERLMKENLSLMNMNYSLNTKLNQLNDFTSKSRNDVILLIFQFVDNGV